MCLLGIFEYCRLPMGYKNSAEWFQRCLQRILQSLIYKGIIQYIDDTLLYGKDENELLDRLEEYFNILLKHNVKLHPGKFTLFSRRLKWCGKEISQDGVKPDEDRVAAARNMPEPVDLAELMSFVYGVALFRNHLPRFAEVAAPLYDLWKDTLSKYQKKTPRAEQKKSN